MLSPIELGRWRASSMLGRTSPLVKLALALAWLGGLAFVHDPLRPLLVTGAAVGGALLLGRVPIRTFGRALGPLGLAAASIALGNLLFAGANTDAGALEIARLGPLRLTAEAVDAALAVGSRVLAIVATGVAFAQTTDPTRLVDALVQQARVPDRFAYGALAAYQAVPRLAGDLALLRGVRRIRGLRWSWHPRIFVGLLVRAIRHADQLALAMDARAFGSGPRTAFRPIRWGWPDLAVGTAGLAVLAGLLAR